MTAPAKPRRLAGLPDVERLAAKLDAACQPVGRSRLELPLTVAAYGLVLLGAQDELREQGIEPLAAQEDPVAGLRGVFTLAQLAAPWLAGHLDALVGWTEREEPDPAAVRAVRKCATVLAGYDLAQAFSLRDGGLNGCADLLGTLYTIGLSHSSKRGQGTFYTPWNVALMMATMTVGGHPDGPGALPPDARILEPACGSGVMVLAAAAALRDAGRDPAACTWMCVDTDPMAIALCGINCLAYGLGPHVELVCGDALTLPVPAAAAAEPAQQHLAVEAPTTPRPVRPPRPAAAPPPAAVRQPSLFGEEEFDG